MQQVPEKHNLEEILMPKYNILTINQTPLPSAFSPFLSHWNQFPINGHLTGLDGSRVCDIPSFVEIGGNISTRQNNM